MDLTLSVNATGWWHYSLTDGELVWMSGMARLLDLPESADEEIGTRLRRLITPLTASALTAQDGETLELEQSIEDSRGRTRSLHFRARRVGAPKPRGLVGVTTDTTGAREESRALARADRYRLLVERSPEAICVCQDGAVVYANPAGTRLLGAGSQVVGVPITDFVRDPQSPILTGNTSELHLNRLDGGVVRAEAVSVPTTWEGRPAIQVVLRDVTTQRETEAALRHQVTHDELTGLLNRAGIKEALAEFSANGLNQIALVFCDIDNFRRVNDSLGHEAGDKLLVAVARRLQAELPKECVVARFSGDEFLIVCPNVSSAGGLELLTKWVSESLRAVVPLHNHMVSVSASTGAAVLEGTMTDEDLLRYADMAMSHAKSRGHGRTSLATPELIAAMEGQLHLEGQLREAINNDELTLHYQPIVTRDGRVVEAEALVRWPRPDGGLLPPGVILPVAERGHLLGALDRWVMSTAFREAADWPDCKVAVNLTGLLPSEPGFVDDVATIIADSGIAWDRVVLELVETALSDLPAHAKRAMTELALRGVRFAIDDFGTGYSSLARLREMPAQIIKLDHHFVTHIDEDAVDQDIARAVVDIARATGHTCIAEGVETPGQLGALDALGIDLYQGYLFSRPVTARDFRRLLRFHGRLEPR